MKSIVNSITKEKIKINKLCFPKYNTPFSLVLDFIPLVHDY